MAGIAWRARAGAARGRSAARVAATLAATLLAPAAFVAVNHAATPAAGGVANPYDVSPVAAASVVVVLADDLSWNLIRFMPHAGRMRRDGLTFRRFIVADSLCCVSRASMLTGRLPHNHRVRSNDWPLGGYERFRRSGAMRQSFAIPLRRLGYRTGYFGKYLNEYGPRRGVDPGWTAWLAGSNAYRGFDYRLSDQGRLRRFGHRRRDYLTDVIARRTAAFIRSSARSGRPFVAVVAPFAPHRPSVAAPRHARRFRRLALPRGPAFDRPVLHGPAFLRPRGPLGARVGHLTVLFRRRARSVLAIDELLGRLRRTLAHEGVTDRTYVLLTSDNGFHLGQHRLTFGKRTAFDTDVRVPAIVVGPGVPAGSSTSALASGIDLAPTLLDLAGTARPARGRDGRSLVPILQGRRPAGWRRVVLVEHAEDRDAAADPDRQTAAMGRPGTYRALRTARYTYVIHADGERELYDDRVDPAQLVNRARSLPAAARRRLDAIADRLGRCRGAGCRRADRAVIRVRGGSLTVGSWTKPLPVG
jgi:arylsulfatase A-like enzyme